MKNESNTWKIIAWFFGILFFVIGVLNMIYVHVVPGIIYIVISLIYFPPVNDFLKTMFGFTIPKIPKIILAFLILWFTLGVGDLMELIESGQL